MDGAKFSATLVITESSGQATGNASTESLVIVENAIAEAAADVIVEVKDGGSADALAESTTKAIGNGVVEISRQETATTAGQASVCAIGKVVAKAVSESITKSLGPNLSANKKTTTTTV